MLNKKLFLFQDDIAKTEITFFSAFTEEQAINNCLSSIESINKKIPGFKYRCNLYEIGSYDCVNFSEHDFTKVKLIKTFKGGRK